MNWRLLGLSCELVLGKMKEMWNPKRRQVECEEARWKGAPAIEPDHCTFVRPEIFSGTNILYSVFHFLHCDCFNFVFPLLNIHFEFIQHLASISSRFTNEENICLHHYSPTLQQYEGVNWLRCRNNDQSATCLKNKPHLLYHHLRMIWNEKCGRWVPYG